MGIHYMHQYLELLLEHALEQKEGNFRSNYYSPWTYLFEKVFDKGKSKKNYINSVRATK